MTYVRHERRGATSPGDCVERAGPLAVLEQVGVNHRADASVRDDERADRKPFLSFERTVTEHNAAWNRCNSFRQGQVKGKSEQRAPNNSNLIA